MLEGAPEHQACWDGIPEPEDLMLEGGYQVSFLPLTKASGCLLKP